MAKLVKSIGIVLGLLLPLCINAMKEQPVTQSTKSKRTHELVALHKLGSVHPDTRDKLTREAENTKRVQAEQGKKLHHAAGKVHIEDAQKALDQGADINCGYPLINLFLRYKQDRRFDQEYIRTPKIFGEGHAMVAWLAKNGVDVNKKCPAGQISSFFAMPSDAWEQEYGSRSPLHYAIQLCKEGCCVSALLDAGAELTSDIVRDPIEDAFYAPCLNRPNAKALKVLLEHPRVSHLVKGSGKEYFRLALAADFENPQDRLAILKALKEAGATLAGSNLVRAAALVGSRAEEYRLRTDMTGLHFLLEHKAPLDEQDWQGTTALLKVVEVPGEYAFNVRSVCAGHHFYSTEENKKYITIQLWKHTPSQLFTDNIVRMKLLLTSGANGSLANNCGVTPLHIAARRGMAAGVTLLLDYNVPVDPRDKEGKTPLHYVVAANIPQEIKNEIIDILANHEHGKLLDMQDIDGKTALVMAIEAYDVATVERLVGHKADQAVGGALNLITPARAAQMKAKRDLRAEAILTLLKVNTGD